MLIFAIIAHGILHQFECHVVLVVNHMNKSRGVIISKNVDTCIMKYCLKWYQTPIAV